jgi:hypothetical protein
MTSPIIRAAHLILCVRCCLVDDIGFAPGWLAAPFPSKDLKEATHSFILLCLSAEGQIRIDPVPQASALSFLGYVAVCFKVGDYSARCLLSDADGDGDLPRGNPRLLSNLAEHQSMIGNELPSRHSYTPFSELVPHRRQNTGLFIDEGPKTY